ncbi:hypothetical protein [Undibacterium sp. Ji22W]|uniref:hypothetical protein n=1 Tax=Undibacterium sp. Ji22W TaxID=3413038 RepID=UPI003BF25738
MTAMQLREIDRSDCIGSNEISLLKADSSKSVLTNPQLTSQESSDEKTLKEFISSHYKDPISVRFQNVTFKNGVMCGELNFKNKFGIYDGFKRFITHGLPTQSIEIFVEKVPISKVGGYFYTKESFFRISIFAHLSHVQMNAIRIAYQTKPVTKVLSPDLAQHVKTLQFYEQKIARNTNSAEMNAYVDEASNLITFEDEFIASCTSS